MPEFDGTPSKLGDWKRSKGAMLQLARPGMVGILDGQESPQDYYTQVPRRSNMNFPGTT